MKNTADIVYVLFYGLWTNREAMSSRKKNCIGWNCAEDVDLAAFQRFVDRCNLNDLIKVGSKYSQRQVEYNIETIKQHLQLEEVIPLGDLLGDVIFFGVSKYPDITGFYKDEEGLYSFYQRSAHNIYAAFGLMYFAKMIDCTHFPSITVTQVK